MFDRWLDLRGEPVIAVHAVDFGIGRIKGITIYPSYFIADADFRVELDEAGENATITILDVKRFKSEKIAIAIK